ncbi:MAG: hypothetical protein C4562_05000 [Actinobacteria bacterium]|nr:MAG: hypothetical protein C4562_05000 [Actinomycetota bacterium]
MNKQAQNDGCCPKFNPEKWDQKTFNWENKNFIMETIPTFLHIPLPSMIGKKVAKMVKAAEDEQKTEADEEVLLLFRDPSAFKSEIYLSVTGSVQGANNSNISGTFISKVFSGPYNAIPKFIKQMTKYLATQGNKAKDYYVHYAYCPKCAKKYGNYMILFAEV